MEEKQMLYTYSVGLAKAEDRGQEFYKTVVATSFTAALHLARELEANENAVLVALNEISQVAALSTLDITKQPF